MFDDGLTKKKKRLVWILAGVVVLVTAAVLIRANRTSAPGVAALAQQSIPLVSVITPALVPVTTTVTVTGTIAARYDIPIGVEGDAGRITAIFVEAGDKVKRGQLLAKLDQSVLRPQINNMAAALEAARAQAALSLAEYRRAESVNASGALSAEEVERRHAASVTDDARVNVAAAQLAEMQARLDRSEIRAPDSGVVLTRTAELGQTASPGGEPLFRIARGGEIEMRGQVAEQDLAQLKLKQPATVYLTGITKPFAGHVRLLGVVIDPKTRLGEIRIALEPDPALRPGAFARGEVIVGNARRPVLPQTAVLSDVRGSYVYVVAADQKVERRTVTISTTTPDGIVVGEGLRGDERVITLAAGFLREGEKVNVAPPAGVKP
jgi:RND family efflux transporter MFP subunit